MLCLLRVLTATEFFALESAHGLPVYLVVLIVGLLSSCAAVDMLKHMPWELFPPVTGFLLLAAQLEDGTFCHVVGRRRSAGQGAQEHPRGAPGLAQAGHIGCSVADRVGFWQAQC